MEENCKSNVSSLDLRKELGLSLNQLKSNLKYLDMDYKKTYNQNEVNQIKNFIGLNLNTTQKIEYKYTSKGWTPLRELQSRYNCNIESVRHYIKRFNIEVYVPSNNISLISKDNLNILDDFFNRYPTPNSRKNYLSKQTCIGKYGVENPSQSELIKNKKKETLLEHYGVTNPMDSEEIRQKVIDNWELKSQDEKDLYTQKTKSTKLEKYGNENYNNSKQISKTYSSKSEKEFADILDKCKSTKLEKYGDEYFSNHEKAKQTCIEKYGVDNPFKLPKVFNSNKEKYVFLRNKIYEKGYTSEQLASIFNKDLSTIVEVITKLGIKKELERFYYIDFSDFPIIENYFETTNMNGVSYQEKELYSFIKSIYKGEIRENVRDIIPPKELDIFIPNKNIAIEFDGLYWHSELYLNNNYHYEKTLECEEKGIQLIHVFEDDWMNKQDIVKSIVATRLGIYKKRYMARKLKIKEVTKKETEKFFNANHLQGFARGDIYLALVDDNLNIIQCVIINRRGFHDGNPELTRMATKLNCQVIGGFSRLLSHIISDYNLSSLVSYIYRAWFNGKGYINSGFKIVKNNPPSYYYIYKGKRVHKSKFRRNRIKYLFDIGYLNYWNKDESEHENMLKNHLYRIYDCGTIKVQLDIRKDK